MTTVWARGSATVTGGVAQRQDRHRRHQLDLRRPADPARPDPHQNAVVVEREGLDRRLVPAGELVARPVGMDERRGRTGRGQVEIAGDPPDAAVTQRPRPVAERRERVAVVVAPEIWGRRRRPPQLAAEHAVANRRRISEAGSRRQ